MKRYSTSEKEQANFEKALSEKRNDKYAGFIPVGVKLCL